MKFLKFILFFGVGLAVVTFALSNRDTIPVDFYPLPYLIELPMFIVFFVAILLGAIISALYSVASRLQLYNEVRHREKRIQALENELASKQVDDNIMSSLPQLEHKS